MIPYCQETDSKMIFPLPEELSFLAAEPSNETIGRILSQHFYPLPGDLDIIKSAWNTLKETVNQEVAREAKKLLTIIQETIVSLQQLEFVGSLPPLRAFNVNDNSLLIEWIFPNFRIGFTIEPNPYDSGWYLVSNKNLGETSASGYIDGMDTKKLFLWLLNFVLANS